MHKGTALILDDEEGWRVLWEDLFQDRGYRIASFDTVPAALRFIRNMDTDITLGVIDKGGSLFKRGLPGDLIEHRGGLSVLAELKDSYPTAIRVLATGEYWEPALFRDHTFLPHIFYDKGWGPSLDVVADTIDHLKPGREQTETIVMDRSYHEKWGPRGIER